MSKIDYQALREKAEKATKGSYIVGHTSVNQHGNLTGVFVCQKWKGEPGGVIAECHVNCLVETDVQAYANAEFIAAFNPNVALALLDERERNQQYIKRRDQENEEIALTVGKLRVELEGKDSKIANLTAERDALREGEMGDARHSNTRAAADIYFQLVEECEIPAGGSLVEYVDDMREKLEAAEKRIAELESGSQAQKLVEAIIVAIENEQERLFDEDYLMDSKECIDVIREEVKRWNDSRAAGIRIKGDAGEQNDEKP
ncbi:ead/Ea22-like family protein [Escherichia coli]